MPLKLRYDAVDIDFRFVIFCLQLNRTVTGLLEQPKKTAAFFLDSGKSAQLNHKIRDHIAGLTEILCTDALKSAVRKRGDLLLTNVVAAGKFDLQRDTGDIRFDRCDASELLVKTDTGDVTGSLLTAKVFLVHTDTGHVRVPPSTTGGKCEIRTDTGDIRIDIP